MSSADIEPRTLAQRKAWVDAHEPRSLYPVVVVEFGDGQVMAFGSLSRFHERAGYDGVVELSYYVGSAWRRQGIGRQLVAWLLDEARRAGHRMATTLFRFRTIRPDARCRASARRHQARHRLLVSSAVRRFTVPVLVIVVNQRIVQNLLCFPVIMRKCGKRHVRLCAIRIHNFQGVGTVNCFTL